MGKETLKQKVLEAREAESGAELRKEKKGKQKQYAKPVQGG